MQKSVSIDIEASPDKVWDVAAGEFDRIGVWASQVSRSSALDAPVSGGPEEPQIAGRVCITRHGKTVEKFTSFDSQKRSFTYEISGDAMPGFVKNATNTWSMQPLSADRTRLTMSVDMITGGVLGKLMAPMMQMGMGKLLRVNLEELKHYIETGKQHDRKRKASHD